jgi:hypothetical protein
MTEYTEAQKALMRASFDLGIAQRELEAAQERFDAAIKLVEKLEELTLPSAKDVRGIMAD